MSAPAVRARALAFAALLAGGALAVVAGAQPWWRAVGEGVSARFSGTEATAGLCQALAVVVLVGTLLLLALRARGRQVLGGLLVVAGIGVALVGGLRSAPSDDAVRSEVRTASLADQFALVPTGWPWVYLAAGLLVAAGGAVTLITASRWPGRADRYRRTEARQVAVAASDDPADVWRALDAGVDPTQTDEDPEAGPPPPPPHPSGADVRNDP